LRGRTRKIAVYAFSLKYQLRGTVPHPYYTFQIYIYTEIEGNGNAFGGAARRIIPRPRTLYGYKEARRRERGGGGRRSILRLVYAYTLPWRTSLKHSII
jgi:hypothetical protein